MSKILVVQPYKMLQHAIVVALFPDHQVQVLEKIPAMDPSAQADAVIIDAGALREIGLAGDELRGVQNWRIPVVLIGAEASGKRATKNCVQLAAPIKKDELRAALMESLRSSVVATAGAGPGPTRVEKKAAAPKPASIAAASGKEVIELVEVIEDLPEDGGNEVEAGN